jgi:branched-subunit amino acid transport protein
MDQEEGMSDEMGALILGMALVTFATRYSMIAVIGRGPLPGWARQALAYVPPAVLAAIVAPGIFAPQGTIAVGLANTQLIAGIVAMLVAWRWRNVVLTISSGLLTLWLLRWAVGL